MSPVIEMVSIYQSKYLSFWHFIVERSSKMAYGIGIG